MQPDTGRIQAYRSPGGPGIRLDGALGAGNTVSRYYDSLLVKVCAALVSILACIVIHRRSFRSSCACGVDRSRPWLRLRPHCVNRLQVIVHGRTYIQAVQKMQRALCECMKYTLVLCCPE